MTRVLLGVMMAGIVAGPAMAADLPVASPATAVPRVLAPTWSGTYVGVNIGGVWGTFNFDPTTTNNLTGAAVATGPTSAISSSVIGGFQGGHNWQAGHWVLGLEHEVEFTGLRQSLTLTGPAGALLPGDALSAKVDFLWAERARLGWAWDRILIYATGGLQTGLVDGSASYIGRPGGSPAFVSTEDDKFHVGYTVGGGVEYALSNRVHFGVEYRFFDLGTQTYNLGTVTGSPAVGASTVTNNIDLRSSEVTARLNIKLNDLHLFGW